MDHNDTCVCVNSSLTVYYDSNWIDRPEHSEHDYEWQQFCKTKTVTV